MNYTVEGVTWELSGKLYQTIYPLLFPFNAYYRAFFQEEPSLPRRIIHAGIVAHGYVYEYSNEGIKKTVATLEGDPGSRCTVDRLLERKSLGKTCVSLWDFDSWLALQKQGRFGDKKYSVVKNQCCHFAVEACKFLGVDSPSEWGQMCEFTETYYIGVTIADAITGSSSSPTSSTS